MTLDDKITQSNSETLKNKIMIEITIKCTGEEIEVTNFLLSEAHASAINNPAFQKYASLTPKKINKAESFRKKMIKAYMDKF